MLTVLGTSPSRYVVVHVGCVVNTPAVAAVWPLAMFASENVTVGTAAPKARTWLDAVRVTARWPIVTVPPV